MPLQILIATFLALVTLGGTLQNGQSRQKEVMIVGGDHYAQLKNSNSNIIVITTVVRSNRNIMVVGERHEGEVKRIFTADTTLPVQQTKNQKRNIIYRAA
jgi:hypothetical protein